MEPLSPGPLEAGRSALLRADWREARRHFEAALAEAETPQALLGLGVAERSLFNGDQAFAAHERGYLLAREAREAQLAARLALELAMDCLTFRGPAETRGWLDRAGRLLEGLPPGEGHGIHAYLRGSFALNVEHDPAKARALAAEGLAIARAGGSVDGEMVCLSLEGLALVAEGAVEEGMRRLDEAAAAAMADEVADARLVSLICCHLIDACKRVRDFGRAAEWCRRVEEVASRYKDAEMFATCRTQYGEVLVWRGAWTDAEAALTAVCRDFRKLRRPVLDALVRLADLRRRQGRPEEATAFLAEAHEHRLAPLVTGWLAFDEGNAERAAGEAERFLRRIGGRDRFERVAALELLVRAALALDRVDEAEEAAAELRAIAAEVGTPPLDAAALLARGRVAAAKGSAEALPALEDAADLFRESGVLYDAAQAELELAACLRGLGRDEEAEQVAQRGRAGLRALGVPVSEPTTRRNDLLTRREQEVLRLLASGRSNEEIAADLVLSVRTVETHVAHVYAKIGVSGRSARAAATAYALAHGHAEVQYR